MHWEFSKKYHICMNFETAISPQIIYWIHYVPVVILIIIIKLIIHPPRHARQQRTSTAGTYVYPRSFTIITKFYDVNGKFVAEDEIVKYGSIGWFILPFDLPQNIYDTDWCTAVRHVSTRTCAYVSPSVSTLLVSGTDCSTALKPQTWCTQSVSNTSTQFCILL